MNTRLAEIWADEDAVALRRRFSELGLDPDRLLGVDPDPQRYERRLRALLLWVDARRRLGSREAMLRHRWLFPPVQSRGDGDEDWTRFETWVQGAHVGSAQRAGKCSASGWPSVAADGTGWGMRRLCGGGGTQ